MKKSAYSALGDVFEELNKDCDYEKWSQYLIKKLKNLGAGEKGLDAGCGNGYFTRALCRAGYSVKGMDLSCEMLSKAVELARDEGVGAEFLLGDITDFKLNGAADFIVAVNDCINYIPPRKLMTAFSNVCKNLVAGGIFIFDISSENKLRNIIGNNMFAEDGEHVTWLWFNTLEKNSVNMDVTVFTLQDDGTYARSDESQTQYIYSEEKIKETLKKSGFSVTAEGHLGGSKLERINFICRKL